MESVKCSFCQKLQHQVRKLIASPGVLEMITGPGVFICDECVAHCVSILDEEGIQVTNVTVIGNQAGHEQPRP